MIRGRWTGSSAGRASARKPLRRGRDSTSYGRSDAARAREADRKWEHPTRDRGRLEPPVGRAVGPVEARGPGFTTVQGGQSSRPWALLCTNTVRGGRPLMKAVASCLASPDVRRATTHDLLNRWSTRNASGDRRERMRRALSTAARRRGPNSTAASARRALERRRRPSRDGAAHARRRSRVRVARPADHRRGSAARGRPEE